MKAEQLARLAIARAARAPRALVIIGTNNQRVTVALLTSIETRAVLSLVGTDGIRVHSRTWGTPPAARTAAA